MPIETTQSAVTEIVVDVGDPEDTKTWTLHGKLGGATEMGDVSIYDMLNTARRYEREVASKAAAALPATADVTLWTIADGAIEVLGIVGRVTTNIQNQACLLDLHFAHSVGPGDTYLALLNGLNVQADSVGTLYTITGVLADAIQKSNAGIIHSCVQPIILGPGLIKCLTSATNTGQIQWNLIYRLCSSAATVT